MKTPVTFFIFSLLIMLIFFTTCMDMCKNVDCGNGSCDAVDGKCLCNTGYELGTDYKCSLESREKFLGDWTGTDSCTFSYTAPNPYLIKIEKDPTNIEKIRISNLLHQNCNPISAKANLNSLNSFEINCTLLHSLSGTATYNPKDSVLTISYHFIDTNGNNQGCNAHFKK